MDIDVDERLDSYFISEAERQWDNLNGEISCYFCEFVQFYVTCCWRNQMEKARSN